MTASPKGFPIEGRLEDLNQLDIRLEAKHTTVVPVGNNRRGLDVVSAGFYEVTAAAVVEAGSTDSRIVLTGHGAKKGDLIRVLTSANGIEEYEMFVEKIISANEFQLAGTVSADFAVGDTIDLLRSVLPKLAQDGSSLSTLIAPPVQILRGPNGVFVAETITKDTANVLNTIPMPVEIVGAAGTEITLTAGDINVQLSHTGANFDATRIGDGTNILAINASLEALVRDADSITELQAILAKIIAAPSTEAKQDTIITSLSTLLTELQAKADLAETQPVSVQSSALPTGAATEATLASIDGKDFATAANQATANADLVLIRNALQLIDNTVNGSNQLDVALADIGLAASEATLTTLAAEDFAQEATLSAMSAKLPAALGPAASAASLTVTMASDQTPIPTKVNDVLSFATIDFSVSNVTGAAYTELIADTGGTAIRKVSIFMSSGDPMYLAIGAAASEVDKMIIFPGGMPHTLIEVSIAANQRLSLKRVVAGTTSAGRIIINLMG